MIARTLDGVVARAVGVAGGVRADLGGLLLGGALDVGGAGLGGLDDGADLLGGGLGEGFGGAALLRALQSVDLIGQLRQERVDGLGLVTTAADGEVALLDGLTVERQDAEP